MITPLGDYVLLEPDEKAKTTTGGIHLPDMVAGEDERPGKIAKVLAIGHAVNIPKGAFERAVLAVGDRVLLSKHTIPEKVPGSKLILVLAGNLIGVVDPAGA